MPEPTTEAGKRLLSADTRYRSWLPVEADAILAIEAEAVAAALTALRAEVVDMDDSCHDYEGLGCERDERGRCFVVSRTDVLALIDAALAKAEG